MFCPNCGKEIFDDAVVCIGCGRAVTPLNPVQTNKTINELGAKKLRKVSRSFRIIGISNIFLGIILTIIGWIPAILVIPLGIFELSISNCYMSTPPKSNKNMSYIAILEIIAGFIGTLWSLFFGIHHLGVLKSPEVIAYLESLGMQRIKGRTRRVFGWILAVFFALALVGIFGAYFLPNASTKVSFGDFITSIIIFGSLFALSIWMIKKPLIVEESSHKNE